MTEFVYGNRIGKTAILRPSVNALIFNSARANILLTRRTDNGRWCLPGGAIDPGENVEEACVREVFEETGLLVRVNRLVGVYSTPHKIIKYADGNKYQGVTISLEAEIVGGSLRTSEETSEFKYVPTGKLNTTDVMDGTHERIQDALVAATKSFIK